MLEQAILSIDNLTDREKFGILAFYAVNVENDLDKGIEYTNVLIELYPDAPSSHNNLGWYFQNLEHYEKAVEEYKVALRIDPYMMIAYGGLIWVYLDYLGQIDSAMTWSNRMIKYGPDNPWGYFYLASAWLCFDSLPKAEMAYKKAMEISPNFTLNMFRLAHTYRLQGNYKEAIGILKKILEINQNETSAYYDLGINYQAMGNPEEARKCFSGFKKIVMEEWMKKWPNDAGTYIALGAVSARLYDIESSEQMLQKAIEIDSTLYDRFAEVLCLQGKAPEAINQLEKALENGYRNLAWLKLDPDLQSLYVEVRYQDLINEFFMKN